MTENYEVYAIRYGTVERPDRQNFLEARDPHDRMGRIDYFVWAAIGAGRTFVIDTGFTEEIAKRRNRPLLRCPTEGLRLIGVEAATVRDVVVTHMHYDHLGGFDRFPAATFHLQDREMAYATGRHMAHRAFSAAYDVDPVVGLVREVYGGRVKFHDGDAELAPGFSLHLIGGHTAGMQVARVHTARGWVVLASDASHLYANMEEGNPFPIIHDMAAMFDGYETLRRLADSDRHIIPGHDPQVMERYPSAGPGLEGIAVRLDAEPSA
jgi:glyoxylase-like metal-dependent hydrolase (beta-lactamase superfamily II)